MLGPLFEPGFSRFSYGFRPRRGAHDAVRQVQAYRKQGYTVAADLDLARFFDSVNFDVLMRRVAAKVSDRQGLRLVWRYLRAGVVENGTWSPTEKGVPQGGPLSPLLANLDPCRFLGFTFRGKRIVGSEKSLARFQHRVRELTGRSWGVSPNCAIPTALSRKSYWHMARTLATQSGMTNAWLESQGLVSVRTLWIAFSAGGGSAFGTTLPGSESVRATWRDTVSLLNRRMRTRKSGGVGAPAGPYGVSRGDPIGRFISWRSTSLQRHS